MEIMNEKDLLEFFILLFPDFEKEWNSENNYSRDKNVFTSHGVCMEFSGYFRENYSKFSDEQLKTLFNRIESLVKDSEPRNKIDNALCTCFLENISQTKSGNFAKPFMGERSKKFFDYWN